MTLFCLEHEKSLKALTFEQTNNHINAPASKSIALTVASHCCNFEDPSSVASDRCSLDDDEEDIINDSETETECSSSVSAQASISMEHNEKLQSWSANDNSCSSSLADCSWQEQQHL
jgi:hypothetical protein